MIVARLLLVLLCVAPSAWAQYAAPDRSDVVTRVDRACPGLVRNDHAFTDAVATLLWQEDARWGRNGKRGNTNDPSHDAIAWRNPASPAGGVSIVDIIGAAGSPSASPAWIDQTQATLAAGTVGAWVRPSGVLPACLSGGGTVPPPVTPPPTIGPDLSAIDAQLTQLLELVADLQSRVAVLQAGQDAGRRELAQHDATLGRLIDQQTRRIFGVLIEADGTTPKGIAEETVDRIWDRQPRLRVRAW